VTEMGSNPPGVWIGDTNIDPSPPPVILASYQIMATSGPDGVAYVQPPSSSISNVVVSGVATAGPASVPFTLQVLPPPAASAPIASSTSGLRTEEGAH